VFASEEEFVHMTKDVDSWNAWEPLKRVIVGRVHGASIPPPDGWCSTAEAYFPRQIPGF
jgi:hypothetical protein